VLFIKLEAKDIMTQGGLKRQCNTFSSLCDKNMAVRIGTFHWNAETPYLSVVIFEATAPEKRQE
jgi:hypothetical protein